MTEQDQLKAITEMRDLMKKSSRFISMSGLSGVAAGLCGLFGTGFAYFLLRDLFFQFPFDTSSFFAPAGTRAETAIDTIATVLIIENLLLGAAVTLILAVLSAWYFTRRKARKLGVSMWDDTAKRMTINLVIPLIAGGAFSLILLSHGLIGLMPGVTLVFYGLGLLNASKYTLDDIRYLGIIEIVLGVIAAAYYQYSLLFWGVGFGVLHIIYGIVLYFKYEMKKG